MSFTILCVISHSTFFAVSYSGRLDRIFHRIKLSAESAAYSRRVAMICTSIVWAMVLMNVSLMLYAMFFTGDHMDILLTPITTHVNLSNLLLARIVSFLTMAIYINAAWNFPIAMSFMLATIFTHQYKALSKSFDIMLSLSDERRLSDSDIATLTD